MKAIISTIVAHFLLSSLSANNVEITGLTQSGNILTFEITWENSWRSGLEFHDAVWIFVKQAPNGGPSWLHANISSGLVDQAYEAVVPDDHVGVFVRRAADGNGTANAQVQLTLENPIGAYRDYQVMAVEMVYVPEGAFYLGDGSSTGTIHKGDDPTSSYYVESEAAMTRGSTSTDFDGGLGTADMPADFPKGYNSFYCMKYPVTQSQYVDFLNCLPRIVQDLRTGSDLSGTTVTNRFVMTDTTIVLSANGIRCDEIIGSANIHFYCDFDSDGIGNESNDGQSKICGYLSPRDVFAYMDWSGLAPMTAFEYEKACRGPLPSVPSEYAWGSTLVNISTVFVNEGEENEKHPTSGVLGGLMSYNNARRVGLNTPETGATRELSNASYYGIMDLTSRYDNLPVYYSISSFPYAGEEGDGSLSAIGEADFISPIPKLQLKQFYVGSSLNSRGTVSYAFYIGNELRRIANMIRAAKRI